MTTHKQYDSECNDETRPRFNWTAISSLSSVDRIHTNEIRTLIPNLLWSRVSRLEIRDKSDANLSKAFRALQLCGEIFHSVARNANEELVSRDKSLKEMSSLLRMSEKQLRKYRNQVKNLQEERNTFTDIIHQYRSLTSSSSSSSMYPVTSLLCRKCLNRVPGNLSIETEPKKTITTFKSGDDVREFLRNAVERLRLHLQKSHKDKIQALQMRAEVLLNEEKQRFVRLSKQMRRTSLRRLDMSLRRRMISSVWSMWRHNHEILLRDEISKSLRESRGECEKHEMRERERKKRFEEKMESTRGTCMKYSSTLCFERATSF